MPALYLSRGALTVPDIADSLDVDSLAITLGQTTYVPALMVSASYAFKAYEGAANRVGPGSTTFVVRPIPDTDDIHWGAVPETDIDGHHTLTKPEKGADYQRPPAWMFNEGKRAYALKAFREQFAAMNGGCQMTGGSAESGTIDVSCLYAGACNEFYELDGTFTDNNTWTGTLCVTFSGTLCFDCASQCFNITAERQ